ncbi:MAG: universal stress protein [Deltaproteobacteria bacterium]|jgi:nucleotide-binding universal stress UspA family protein
MENILVAINPAEPRCYAGVHAVNLAKRIQARVLFLLVYPPLDGTSPQSGANGVEVSMNKSLSALIEEARSDGIPVECYVARDPFEKEIVSFVKENRITLLVVESANKSIPGHESGGFLNKIRHRINCPIEVVNEKPEWSNRKE